MVHQHLVQRLGQVLGAAAVGNVPVGEVGLEELLLGAAGVLQRHVSVDILLRAVHHADEAQAERVDVAREDVERMRARVH